MNCFSCSSAFNMRSISEYQGVGLMFAFQHPRQVVTVSDMAMNKCIKPKRQRTTAVRLELDLEIRQASACRCSLVAHCNSSYGTWEARGGFWTGPWITLMEEIELEGVVSAQEWWMARLVCVRPKQAHAESTLAVVVMPSLWLVSAMKTMPNWRCLLCIIQQDWRMVKRLDQQISGGMEEDGDIFKFISLKGVELLIQHRY